jgi:hypothetical protein
MNAAAALQDASATTAGIGGAQLQVATLSDIIRSKRAAGRARDLAVLEVLEKTLDETARLQEGEAGSSQEGE